MAGGKQFKVTVYELYKGSFNWAVHRLPLPENCPPNSSASGSAKTKEEAEKQAAVAIAEIKANDEERKTLMPTYSYLV